MKTQLLANGVLAIGLFAGCAAHAQNIVYDFTVAPAGIGAAGGLDGSFDYYSGAITNFSWQREQWSTLAPQGKNLSFMDSQGNVLTTTLFTPLGGRSATASDLVVHFAGGGLFGFCGGSSGLCDSGPVVFTAVKGIAAAPELDSGSMASALTLLLGGIAVIEGRRRRSYSDRR
jgi:hypothetical protein